MSSSPLLPVFVGLEPAIVWSHFATLCAIPRPSKGEARLTAHLKDWATTRGLDASIDAAGNLLVRKPASPGFASAPGVILQAHLDMVCQNNADVPHDFSRDPILPVLRDNWLVAEGTTLGADNGIGVAIILAVLESDKLAHGPIEALLTVDEESGMGGVRGLAPGILAGKRMLNLDAGKWGEFCLGCAGGIDVNVHRAREAEAVPAGYTGVRIDLRGLQGGHSGGSIHEGRGNAIKLLVRVLRQIEHCGAPRLSTLQGGTARNALPREAFATLALPTDAVAVLPGRLAELQVLFRKELADIDDGVSLSAAPCKVDRVMPAGEQAVWLTSLHAAPFGVRRMSVQAPGAVETSNNLGIVELTSESGACNFMVRSMVDSAGAELADEIVSLFALSGSETRQSGHYPGWRPDFASPLLGVCHAVFRDTFGYEPKNRVTHGGLECGIIGGKYPGLEMIAFGPMILGAHAPGESVEVESVARCWKLVTAILAALR